MLRQFLHRCPPDHLVREQYAGACKDSSAWQDFFADIARMRLLRVLSSALSFFEETSFLLRK
jgi:hypothetical protein